MRALCQLRGAPGCSCTLPNFVNLAKSPSRKPPEQDQRLALVPVHLDQLPDAEVDLLPRVSAKHVTHEQDRNLEVVVCDERKGIPQVEHAVLARSHELPPLAVLTCRHCRPDLPPPPVNVGTVRHGLHALGHGLQGESKPCSSPSMDSGFNDRKPCSFQPQEARTMLFSNSKDAAERQASCPLQRSTERQKYRSTDLLMGAAANNRALQTRRV
jgi:hypothetical protein